MPENRTQHTWTPHWRIALLIMQNSLRNGADIPIQEIVDEFKELRVACQGPVRKSVLRAMQTLRQKKLAKRSGGTHNSPEYSLTQLGWSA